MKSRLNITVDEILMEQAKRYAEKHKTSLSKLIENYFKNLIRPTNKKNVIDLIESLPKPSSRVTNNKENLKEHYFKAKKSKYGF
ncbi:MAG: DUF6364 family protein [Agriterribacter sp.]